MNTNIKNIIEKFSNESISSERKEILQPLIDYIHQKIDANEPIRLNFICTHNSRRSHLSQIWAQTLAHYYNIPKVSCYSGGTEATAMFPKVAETLTNQGFKILTIAETTNPIYAVKYSETAHPIICFSKTYDHPFNPSEKYAAIMTCNNADEGCPVVIGSEKRIPIKFNDPKAFDGTELMNQKYAERSLEIAQELNFVFSSINPIFN